MPELESTHDVIADTDAKVTARCDTLDEKDTGHKDPTVNPCQGSQRESWRGEAFASCGSDFTSREFRNGRFQCVEPNCKVSCKRKSDLRRHVATAHRGVKAYWCPIPGCDRSYCDDDSGRPFPRKDKRDAHVKKVHGERNLEAAVTLGVDPRATVTASNTPQSYQDGAGPKSSWAMAASFPRLPHVEATSSFNTFAIDNTLQESFNATPIFSSSSDLAMSSNFLIHGGMPSLDKASFPSSESDLAGPNDFLGQKDVQMPQETIPSFNGYLFAHLINQSPSGSIEMPGSVQQGCRFSELDNPLISASNLSDAGQTGAGDEHLQQDLDAWLMSLSDDVETRNAEWPHLPEEGFMPFDANGGL